jgi:hypothetical protein
MSMTHCSKRRIDFFAAMPVLGLSVLLVLALSGKALRAQIVEIKIVNGRNGHSVANRCMNVWVGDRSNPRATPLLETQTDTNGIIRLRLTDEDAKIDVQSQQLVCGLQGVINPIVKYGDTIGIRAGYVSCQPHTPDYSWLAMTDFTTKQVVQQGIVTTNACGKATASPKPGEVILFVRPLTWWEKLKQ